MVANDCARGEAPAAQVTAPDLRGIERVPTFESQPRKEEIIFATLEPWVAKQEPTRDTPQWQPAAGTTALAAFAVASANTDKMET
jgi:hypothetical protein